jgi:hypothetical protein
MQEKGFENISKIIIDVLNMVKYYCYKITKN